MQSGGCVVHLRRGPLEAQLIAVGIADIQLFMPYGATWSDLGFLNYDSMRVASFIIVNSRPFVLRKASVTAAATRLLPSMNA
jgi:hypothetical protein